MGFMLNFFTNFQVLKIISAIKTVVTYGFQI